MKAILRRERRGRLKLLVFLFVFGSVNLLYAQWVQTNGPYGGTVKCFAVSGTNLFPGTLVGGVWRRPLSEMTSVERSSTDVPTDFGLEQNYPNPFNPATNIMYTVPGREYVNLTVYNILGEEIAILVDEEKTPGKYTVTFDGSKLSSGVYFYRLHAGKFNETREMVLVK